MGKLFTEKNKNKKMQEKQRENSEIKTKILYYRVNN